MAADPRLRVCDSFAVLNHTLLEEWIFKADFLGVFAVSNVRAVTTKANLYDIILMLPGPQKKAWKTSGRMTHSNRLVRFK